MKKEDIQARISYWSRKKEELLSDVEKINDRIIELGHKLRELDEQDNIEEEI